MLTVNIKIENNNLQKAKTELEALLSLVNTLAETYETTFDEPKKEVAEKKSVKKTTSKAKPAPKAKEESKPEPEVKEEVKAIEEASETITLKELTDLARASVKKSDRNTVAELIASFGEGKLSSVDEAKYPELKEALEAL